jgi:outer membrane biosynthesis protein TonB
MVWNSGVRRVTKRLVACVKIFRPASAHPFPKTVTAMLIAAGLLLLAGCTTAKSPTPVEVATPELSPAPPATPEPKPQQPAPVVPAPKPPEVIQVPPTVATPEEPIQHAPEHLKIRIESSPVGAMIVVDGKPLGRTPVELEVDAANNGFFKEPVTIRARFVASDSASESYSIDEELGPLERVPLALVFSRDGVQRILRQY